MNSPSSSWPERLRSAGQELAQGLVQLLYPGACRLCGQPLPAGEAQLCGPCRSTLSSDPSSICPRCAATVGPFVHMPEGCSHCRAEAFAFERVVRLGSYDGPLREAILRMKLLTGEGLAEALGDLWAEQLLPHLGAQQADVLVPVPLHWWRRWRRGYNQSEALADRLAVHLRLPCRPAWLRRVRNTPRQAVQSPAERRANLRGRFPRRSRAELAGRCVLLIDDVLTTGCTASEAARTLREAGAAKVVVAVLARGGTG